jgi:hypothetical protein
MKKVKKKSLKTKTKAAKAAKKTLRLKAKKSPKRTQLTKKTIKKLAQSQQPQIFQINHANSYRVEMARQVTVLDKDNKKVYRLKDLSAYLWLHLDGTRTLDEIINLAQKELGITDSKFPKLVKSFMQNLVAQDLIHSLPQKLSNTQAPTPLGINISLMYNDLNSLKKFDMIPINPLDAVI